jgi:O-succinylbenzoate synthase
VALAVAAQEGFTLPTDLGPSASYYDRDIVEPPAAIDELGDVAVPEGPGLGARVRTEILDAVTEHRWSVGDTAA